MSFEEDFSEFIDDFKDVVTKGDASTFNAIFDEPFYDAMQVEASVPSLLAATADVAGIEQGNPLVVNEVTYYVRGIEPEGTGMTRLVLEPQNTQQSMKKTGNAGYPADPGSSWYKGA